MVVPGVIGQVVVAFHDMHAGKSSLKRLFTMTVRYAAFVFCFVGLVCEAIVFSCQGDDAHKRPRFWRESGQGKVTFVTCHRSCLVLF
jgi:hypothetical protein